MTRSLPLALKLKFTVAPLVQIQIAKHMQRRSAHRGSERRVDGDRRAARIAALGRLAGRALSGGVVVIAAAGEQVAAAVDRDAARAGHANRAAGDAAAERAAGIDHHRTSSRSRVLAAGCRGIGRAVGGKQGSPPEIVVPPLYVFDWLSEPGPPLFTVSPFARPRVNVPLLPANNTTAILLLEAAPLVGRLELSRTDLPITPWNCASMVESWGTLLQMANVPWVEEKFVIPPK